MEYNTDFEVRQATLDALGIDPAGLQNIYEVDLAILDAIQQGGGGGGGGTVEPIIIKQGETWTEELNTKVATAVGDNNIGNIIFLDATGTYPFAYTACQYRKNNRYTYLYAQSFGTSVLQPAKGIEFKVPTVGSTIAFTVKDPTGFTASIGDRSVTYDYSWYNAMTAFKDNFNRPLYIQDGVEWDNALYEAVHARLDNNTYTNMLLVKDGIECQVIGCDQTYGHGRNITLYGMWNVPGSPYQFISFEEPYEITDTVVLELSTGYMMDGVNSVLEAVLNN